MYLKNNADKENHLRLFNLETLNFWVNKYFKVEDIKLVPYKTNGATNNIFYLQQKTTRLMLDSTL